MHVLVLVVIVQPKQQHSCQRKASFQLWPFPVPLWQLSYWLGQVDLDLASVSQHCIPEQPTLHGHMYTQLQQVVSAYKQIR